MSNLFIQYITEGRVEELTVDLDSEVKKKAFALVKAGFGFTVQHLTRLPGKPRVYFAIKQGEVVLGNAICVDGPKAVPKAVTKMIEKAHARWERQSSK